MNGRRRPSLVDHVREALMEDLMSGALEPGAQLPNENEIARRFAVSRATVREAVQGLVESGYVIRRHGFGTFVTFAPRTRYPLETTVSYTAMIREAGHTPGERVLSKRVRDPSRVERGQLDLRDGERVVEIERVRLAGRRPAIYSRDSIPHALLEDLPEESLGGSLYALLEDIGHPVTRARARLVPTLATAKLARTLEIKRGTPLLHVAQVDYDERGLALMLSYEWLVADAFDLIVNRRTSSSPEA